MFFFLICFQFFLSFNNPIVASTYTCRSILYTICLLCFPCCITCSLITPLRTTLCCMIHPHIFLGHYGSAINFTKEELRWTHGCCLGVLCLATSKLPLAMLTDSTVAHDLTHDFFSSLPYDLICFLLSYCTPLSVLRLRQAGYMF
jgi:hypothetical protein